MQIPAELITIAAVAATSMFMLFATAIAFIVAYATHIAAVAFAFAAVMVMMVPFLSARFKIFAEAAARHCYIICCSAHFTVIIVVVIVAAVAAVVSVAVEQVPAKNAAISETTAAIVSVIIVCHVMASFNLSYSTGYDKTAVLVNDK